MYVVVWRGPVAPDKPPLPPSPVCADDARQAVVRAFVRRSVDVVDRLEKSAVGQGYDVAAWRVRWEGEYQHGREVRQLQLYAAHTETDDMDGSLAGSHLRVVPTAITPSGHPLTAHTVATHIIRIESNSRLARHNSIAQFRLYVDLESTHW